MIYSFIGFTPRIVSDNRPVTHYPFLGILRSLPLPPGSGRMTSRQLSSSKSFRTPPAWMMLLIPPD